MTTIDDFKNIELSKAGELYLQHLAYEDEMRNIAHQAQCRYEEATVKTEAIEARLGPRIHECGAVVTPSKVLLSERNGFDPRIRILVVRRAQ